MKLYIEKKGFTLIELLVSVAIIGILTAIITANLAQAKSKSRDAKRISDISQLQLAVELYGDRCNQYPGPTPQGQTNAGLPYLEDGGGCPAGIYLKKFISQLPVAPPGGGYFYEVEPSNRLDYILKAQLENDSSLDRFNTSKLGLSCSAKNVYCVTSR